MKASHACLRSGITLDFTAGSIFKVFLRRSNCPKKIIKITPNAQEAIDTYTGVKLFKNDRVYIFANGIKLLSRAGTEERPYSLRGKKKALQYKRKPFTTPNMPQTAHDALLALDRIVLNNEIFLSASKAVILMSCHLASLAPEAQIAFLESCLPDYKKHLFLSGCDSSEIVEDQFIEFNDDLL